MLDFLRTIGIITTQYQCKNCLYKLISYHLLNTYYVICILYTNSNVTIQSVIGTHLPGTYFPIQIYWATTFNWVVFLFKSIEIVLVSAIFYVLQQRLEPDQYEPVLKLFGTGFNNIFNGYIWMKICYMLEMKFTDIQF